MPIDYKKYPKNWAELRAQVLDRAYNCCEFCGLANYAVGYRMPDGQFLFHHIAKQKYQYEHDIFLAGGRRTRIVLTIAHLDHDETNHNVSIDRLRALCQRCHLRYDIQEKKKRRHNKKAVGDLFQ